MTETPEKTTRHIMLDLEMLSLSSRAAVVQIGAVSFDPFGTAIGRDAGFQVCVAAQSSLMLAGEISESTLAWWRDAPQAESAQAVMHMGSTGGVAFSVEEALRRFAAWWLTQDGLEVWSNGAGCDVVILEHFFRALGIEPPWRFYNVRDTRTIWWLAESTGVWQRQKRASHVAMQDAVDQAEDVQAAVRALNLLHMPLPR